MIAILYAAKTRLTPQYYRVVAWRGQVAQEVFWVRATLDNSGDELSDIVARAKPRKGETVLNAIELTI